MVPALTLMYVEEDLYALVLLNTALEHAHCAALDDLIVDDAVGRHPVWHLPGFSLVHGECFAL